MKISAVLQNTFKRNFTTNRNVDLTSFGGENNRSQTSSMTDKNANEALKNNGMSHVSFTGITQNWYLKSVPLGGTSGTNYYLTLEDGDKEHSKDIGNSRYVYSVADSQLIKQEHDFWAIISEHSHRQSNSLMVRTSNPYITNRIYFADPEEAVSAQTKKDHDFVVYDTRPVYPTLASVREIYYNPNTDAFDLSKSFKNVGEYYYRLEMADKKEHDKLVTERKNFQSEYDQSRSYKETIDARIENTPWNSNRTNNDKEKADYYFSMNHAKMEDLNQKIGYYQDRINFAKEQQKKASEGYKLFQEVGLILYERDEARNTYQRYEELIPYYENKRIPELEEDIKEYTKKKEEAEAERDYYQKQVDAIKTYRELKKNSQYGLSEQDRIRFDTDEHSINWRIPHAANEVEKQESYIASTKRAIKEALEYIEKGKEEMPALKEKFLAKAEEAKTYYAKMEEFYRNNIEEWQCA